MPGPSGVIQYRNPRQVTMTRAEFVVLFTPWAQALGWPLWCGNLPFSDLRWSSPCHRALPINPLCPRLPRRRPCPAQNAPLDCAAVIKDRDDGKITTKTEARQLIECLKTNFGDPGRLGGGPGSISTAQQPPPAYLLGDPSNILPQDFIGTYNNGLQS